MRLILALFLCSVGSFILRGSAKSPITPRNQAIYVLAGIVTLVIGIVFVRKVRNWEKWIPWLMALSLLALLSPIVLSKTRFGGETYGAYNWIGIRGKFTIQPSEFVKLSLLIVLAASFSRHAGFKPMLITLAFAAMCCGIQLVAKDLGSLLLYFLTTVFLFYASTSNLFLTGAGLGMGAIGSVIAYKLFPHVRTRIEIWQNPWADPSNSGLQIVQALIAIGSGGAFGMGLGMGMPRSIPLYHSDFVFAAISEEFGWIFAVCLLLIYLFIVLRSASIAMSARVSYHAMLGLGIVAMLGLQTLIIVGGVIKLIPLTGITLPFVAAGGSSIVSCMGLMGMLLGISSLNTEDDVADVKKMEWREDLRG